MERDDEIENWFTYHAPSEEQKAALVAIRESAKALAYVIRRNTPRSADQTAALRLLREAVMTANAAIVIPRQSGILRSGPDIPEQAPTT